MHGSWRVEETPGAIWVPYGSSPPLRVDIWFLTPVLLRGPLHVQLKGTQASLMLMRLFMSPTGQKALKSLVFLTSFFKQRQWVSGLGTASGVTLLALRGQTGEKNYNRAELEALHKVPERPWGLSIGVAVVLSWADGNILYHQEERQAWQEWLPEN